MEQHESPTEYTRAYANAFPSQRMDDAKRDIFLGISKPAQEANVYNAYSTAVKNIDFQEIMIFL